MAKSEWKTYRSHKEVQAAPITNITHHIAGNRLHISGVEEFTPTVAEMAAKAKVGDYALIYRDGYKSICPKKEFEDGYTEI